MPNPYHDETGKFCSAGEMSAAVSRLVGQGKWVEAQVLQKEYDQLKTSSGFTANEIVNNQNLTNIANLGDHRPITDPGNVILTQDWTDEELTVQENFADKQIAYFQKENVELEAEQQKIVSEFQKTFNTTETPYSAMVSAGNLKSKGEEILQDAYTQAKEAGVPAAFAHYYVYDRVAPALGIKDGNGYMGRVTYAKPVLGAFTVTSLPKVKEVDKREKLNAVFAALQENEQVKLYNEAVGVNRDIAARSIADVKQTSSLARQVRVNDEAIQAQKRVKEIVSSVKTWRKTVTEAGASNSAKLYTAGQVASDLTVDNTGAVNNAWGYKDGQLDRIVRAETLEYPRGAAHLVGESGAKYFSLVHYHSYKKHVSTSHVLVDKTVKGESFQNAQPHPVGFSYTIDSGD